MKKHHHQLFEHGKFFGFVLSRNSNRLFIRVIKVDRPLRSGYSQPGSPYGNPCSAALPSYSNGVMGGNGAYRTHSVVGSVGRPVAYPNVMENNPSFSSASSFEYAPPAPVPTAQPAMMMMQAAQQQLQPMGVMQQQQQPVQQQFMYRPVQMQSSVPQLAAPAAVPSYPSPYVPQNYMYPTHQGMSFGYRPMMQQQGRMIPSGMPMMAAGNPLAAPAATFPSQPSMFNPMAQQLVF